MTTDLNSRKILDDGTVICNEEALIELLFQNESISDLFCDDILTQEEWNHSLKICDKTDPGPTFTNSRQYDQMVWDQYWFTPEPYKSLDVKSWCLAKCQSKIEIERTNAELIEITNRNMLPVMRHLIYCVDVWRSKNIVWGVGRGSSVSSYVLYLIGINRINPIKYNLDFKEWLK